MQMNFEDFSTTRSMLQQVEKLELRVWPICQSDSDRRGEEATIWAAAGEGTQAWNADAPFPSSPPFISSLSPSPQSHPPLTPPLLHTQACVMTK